MFQLKREEIRDALKPVIVPGKYQVKVSSASRDEYQPDWIRLWLSVSLGAFYGTSAFFSFREPDHGLAEETWKYSETYWKQSDASLRHCVRALWALGIQPTDDGVFWYKVEDLVGRECIAELQLRYDDGGRLVVAIPQDGLFPMNETDRSAAQKFELLLEPSSFFSDLLVD